MAVKNTSLGRKNISSTVYKLILLAAALRDSFDVIEASAIQSRFGITKEEAVILMDLLQLSSENGYLPLPLTGDEDALALIGESSFRTRRLILSDEETLALKEAFTALALPKDSIYWKLLEPPYTASSSIKDSFLSSFVSKSHSEEIDLFFTCSNAIAESRVISFEYPSEAAAEESKFVEEATLNLRAILPFQLSYGENGWLVEGIDLNLEQLRVFRINRMRSVKTRPASLEQRKLAEKTKETSSKEVTQTVKLVFFDKSALTHYSWPGLKTVGNQRNTSEVKATIPYYGGTWLLQRLIALKGKVKTEDETVQTAMRKYAESLLEKEGQL